MNKMYTAEVIADSISPEGHRITSVKVIYPHAVHKDMLRHRCMNRNVESFRAQPPEKLIESLYDGAAFKPDVFGHRTKGMGQRNEPLEGQEAIDQEKANLLWDGHVSDTLWRARVFINLGVAKQQVNFLLQDLCPLTEIITATDWSNFAALRTELNDDGTPVARPEVYKTAQAIMAAIEDSVPRELKYGWLHLPFISEEELSEICRRRKDPNHYGWAVEGFWTYVSAGRCARISYGDYDWMSESANVSYNRAAKLLQNGHMSPFEQQARPFSEIRWDLIHTLQQHIRLVTGEGGITEVESIEMQRQLEYSGNLHGWVPARKKLPNEWDYSLIKGHVS